MDRIPRRPSIPFVGFLVTLLFALALAAFVSGDVTAQTDTSPLTPTPTDDSGGTVPVTATPTASPTPIPFYTTTYVVQQGDTLSLIACRYRTTVTTLMQLNALSNPNRIFAGQRLIVPDRPPQICVAPTEDTTEDDVQATPTVYISYEAPRRTPTPTPTPTPIPSAWDDPDEAIELLSPVAGAAYHSPMRVIGFSQTFEGSVVVRLVDADGNVLAERPTIGGSVGGFDFFETHLIFIVEEEQEAMLEAFEISARNGEEINKVSVPVILLPGQPLLLLDSPTVGERVCSPVSTAGYSGTEDGNVTAEIVERNGDVIVVQSTPGGTPAIYRDFFTAVALDVEDPEPLLVGAYAADDLDFTQIDLVRVPISLYPEDSAVCTGTAGE